MSQLLIRAINWSVISWKGKQILFVVLSFIGFITDEEAVSKYNNVVGGEMYSLF